MQSWFLCLFTNCQQKIEAPLSDSWCAESVISLAETTGDRGEVEDRGDEGERERTEGERERTEGERGKGRGQRGKGRG